MPLLTTDAIVLHAFDYMETSRIYRLLTREAGMQSVLARGARRPKSRFGSALDLFAQGEAQLSIRPTRELQTLTAFDVTHTRPGLASGLERFTAAAAIAELVLRFACDDYQPALYHALESTIDEIADQERAPRDAALGGAWRLIAELGFAPAVDSCSGCHAALPAGVAAGFSHPAGGILCDSCAGRNTHRRILPPSAVATLRAWLAGRAPRDGLDEGEGRAHQRLLREFLVEHLDDGRGLRAFDIWARGEWLGPLSCVHATR
jgi:DNA repair protein RecO (recombination protein O)